MKETLMTEETQSEQAPEAPPQAHIYTAFRAVMKAVRGVPKAGRMMSGTHASAKVQYTFQRYDDMAAALGAAFREHGIGVQTVVLAKEYHRWEKTKSTGDKTLWTSCVLTKRFVFTSLVDASAMTIEACGEGSDSSDKATNKAETACFKTALKQAFLLSTDDDTDPDASRPEVTEQVRNQPTQQQRHEARQQDPWLAAEQAAASGPVDASAERATAAAKGVQALARCRTTGDALRITQWAAENGLLGVSVNSVPLAAHILSARATLREGPATQQAHQTQPPPDSQVQQRFHQEVGNAVRDLPSGTYPPDDGGY
jgi:ERF superfamily